MSETYTWSQMLDEFRALGGKAENVEQRRGRYGNGLFPVDPEQPIHIAVPDHLLIDSDQLVLEGEALVVSPTVEVTPEVRGFIARYQKFFSWGAEGRRNVEAFESALKTLPEPLLARLRQIRLLDLAKRHQGPWLEMLRRRFLNSRQINYHGRKVSMPIIELINHAATSPGYGVGKGIIYRGRFKDEITVNYSPTSDALLRFLNYGFASPELQAYSLPVQLNLKDGRVLQIGVDGGGVTESKTMPTPTLEIEGQRWKLSHLRVGMERSPRLPRTLMRKALETLEGVPLDEEFERIRQVNQLELCRLLELAEGVDTPIVREFRQALIYQLKALSHCYGVREDLLTANA